MYRDLKQFTANIDDFKFMRQVVDSIVDVEPLDTNSHPTSVVSDSQSGKSRTGSETRPGMPSACIPFIGTILSFALYLAFLCSLLCSRYLSDTALSS